MKTQFGKVSAFLGILSFLFALIFGLNFLVYDFKSLVPLRQLLFIVFESLISIAFVLFWFLFKDSRKNKDLILGVLRGSITLLVILFGYKYLYYILDPAGDTKIAYLTLFLGLLQAFFLVISGLNRNK